MLSTIPNVFNASFGDKLWTCREEIVSAEEKMRAADQSYIFSTVKLCCYAELVGKRRNHRYYHFEANKRCLEIILSTLML